MRDRRGNTRSVVREMDRVRTRKTEMRCRVLKMIRQPQQNLEKRGLLVVSC